MVQFYSIKTSGLAKNLWVNPWAHQAEADYRCFMIDSDIRTITVSFAYDTLEETIV